ncbi:MAG TPA: cysteine desulfurase NifS [candidate division Zixibacteria bacterium]|nr:cysteine desulfurase NifS [candidate division Zixibacteria bacterium]
MKMTYFDHNATTPMRPEVLEAMLPYLRDHFGNASSIHSAGREARKAVEEARIKVARALGCDQSEVVFTGSGTEADNQAVKGVFFALRGKRDHLVCSKIEHHAVLHVLEHLEKHHGARNCYLGVDGQGLADPEALRACLTDATALVSVMLANNEVGTVQPVAELSAVCRERGALFHTDAVQAFGKLDCDVKKLGVDLLSLSAHKIYGPKGVGALYVRKGTRLHSLVHGGGHERSRRAGTENVAGIVGLGEAAQLAMDGREQECKKLAELRDRLWRGIQSAIPEVRRNGHPDKTLPGTLSVCFRYIEGESVLLMLDMKGIACSSGSACTSGSLEPSHVLAAMGVPVEEAQGSVRFSLGRDNTGDEVDRAVEVIKEAVAKLRSMSPIAPAGNCGSGTAS